MSGTAIDTEAHAERVTRTTAYPDLPEWMSVTETSNYLGVTKWWVYNACHTGNLPYRRLGPKLIQIPKSWFHPNRAMRQVTS
jgi:excisionase family DNA binding protein